MTNPTATKLLASRIHRLLLLLACFLRLLKTNQNILKSGDKTKSTTTIVLSQNIQKFFNILIAKFGCTWWRRYGSNLIRRIAKNLRKRRTRLFLLSDEVKLQQSSNKIHLRSINGKRVTIRQRKNTAIFGKI